MFFYSFIEELGGRSKVFASMVFRWMLFLPPMDVFLVCLVLWQSATSVKHRAQHMSLLFFLFCLVRMAVGQHPKWSVLSDVIGCVLCRFWIAQCAGIQMVLNYG